MAARFPEIEPLRSRLLEVGDTHVSLAPGSRRWLAEADSSFQQVFSRLVTHYWSNGCFLDDAGHGGVAMAEAMVAALNEFGAS